MADVELDDRSPSRPRARRCGSSARDPRAREPERASDVSAAVSMRSSSRAARRAGGFGVGARVQLDDGRAGLGARLDLRARPGSMNSDTRMPCCGEPRDTRPRPCFWPATSRPPSVVSSSRRSGTKQQSAGRCLIGELEHRVRHGHLEIHARLHRAQQHLEVARLDVAAILAQMHGDAVRARLAPRSTRPRRDRGSACRALAAASRRDRR